MHPLVQNIFSQIVSHPKGRPQGRVKIEMVLSQLLMEIDFSGRLTKFVGINQVWPKDLFSPGGGILSDGDDRNFFGFEIFDSVIFLGRKIWQVFYLFK